MVRCWQRLRARPQVDTRRLLSPKPARFRSLCLSSRSTSHHRAVDVGRSTLCNRQTGLHACINARWCKDRMRRDRLNICTGEGCHPVEWIAAHVHHAATTSFRSELITNTIIFQWHTKQVGCPALIANQLIMLTGQRQRATRNPVGIAPDHRQLCRNSEQAKRLTGQKQFTIRRVSAREPPATPKVPMMMAADAKRLNFIFLDIFGFLMAKNQRDPRL